MRINKILTNTLMTIMLVLPAALSAQNSSINTFSPYTFYGIGDFSQQGTANLRSMGGAGVAYRDPYSVNYLNPASYSATPRKSLLFNFGMEGYNTYLETTDKKSSYNTFNVRDIALQFPLGKSVGFGISVTPYTNVGYRSQRVETDQDIIADIGNVKYKYTGEGGLTQLKAGIGWEIFKNFSVGAEMIFYMGNIDRSFGAEITPVTAGGALRNTSLTQYEEYSRFYGSFGVQYSPIVNNNRILTFGGVYQMGGNLKPSISRYVTSTDVMYGEWLLSRQAQNEIALPEVISAGVNYRTARWAVGADYVYNNWEKSNKQDAGLNGDYKVSYTNTNTYKAGLEFTPNRVDIRSYFKRISWRLGFRYSDYYLKFNNHAINDKAITFGAGFPTKFLSATSIDFGMEFGQRGTTRHNLIKENYFKFSIGLSLFGDDDWFKKMRFH